MIHARSNVALALKNISILKVINTFVEPLHGQAVSAFCNVEVIKSLDKSLCLMIVGQYVWRLRIDVVPSRRFRVNFWVNYAQSVARDIESLIIIIKQKVKTKCLLFNS